VVTGYRRNGISSSLAFYEASLSTALGAGAFYHKTTRLRPHLAYALASKTGLFFVRRVCATWSQGDIDLPNL